MSIAGKTRPLLELARKVQFHIARTLELLIYHIVHARASVDYACCDDGQGAAFLNITRRCQRSVWEGRAPTDRYHPIAYVQKASQPGYKRAPGGLSN